MLLTLNASCLRPLLAPAGRGKSPKPAAKLDLLDLPRYAQETLGLAGLAIPTDLLAGADRARLDKLRERGDKAACACLLLLEPEPQSIAQVDDAAAKPGTERIKRVLEAAQILGCSSAAVSLAADDSDPAMLRLTARLKPIVARAEKLDINLLIAPHSGLTSTAEKVTDLIKKVGGFRIGTFPDFQAASAVKDPVTYLRRLTPYASALSASTVKFTMTKPPKGEEPQIAADAPHEAYDLRQYIEAVRSVGYDSTLAIDYRGPGDVTMGVVYSRNALQAAIGGHLLEELGEDDLGGEFLEGDEE